MASRFFEKMPPNNGSVAGFKWQHHGGHHRLNSGGGMAEESFFFFEIFAIDRLGHVGLTRPNPKPNFQMKMG